MSFYLGIDLGGTNIAVGLVNEDFQIINRQSVKTKVPRPATEICKDMAAICRELTQRCGISMDDIAWIGVGAPGIVWDGTVCYSSNLGMQDTPVAALLTEELHKPVFLQNDANAAAYGEFVAGAGKDCHSMVVMTIGTGIGSGIILDGKIHDGFNGAAAELGHTIIHPGGRSCPCGKNGCIEVYCSATAIINSTKLALGEDPQTDMWRICDGDIEKVNAKTAFDAMRHGDATATQVVEEFLEYLALGTANVINLIQPEVFCIGGGVSKEGDGIVVPLRERVERLSFAGRGGLRTKIVTAKLGNDAGIVGAAMLGMMPVVSAAH